MISVKAIGLFGHTQHNGAALGVGHGGIRLPKTAGHATACRLEFGVDALGAGLQGEKRSSWRMGLLIQVFTWSGPLLADHLTEHFPA